MYLLSLLCIAEAVDYFGNPRDLLDGRVTGLALKASLCGLLFSREPD